MARVLRVDFQHAEEVSGPHSAIVEDAIRLARNEAALHSRESLPFIDKVLADVEAGIRPTAEQLVESLSAGGFPAHRLLELWVDPATRLVARHLLHLLTTR